MNKHTPGPWKVHRHDHVDGELWLTVLRGAWDITGNYAADPGVIADAKYSAMSDEENEANARLIAAAPALLEALERAVSSLPVAGDVDANGYTEVQYSTEEWDEMVAATKQARAAIATAKGE